MVEITLLELNFPNAEAEFNAPFAGRDRASGADTENDVDAETDAAPAGPSSESVVALLVGLLSVAALVWLRSRGGADDEDTEADD